MVTHHIQDASESSFCYQRPTMSSGGGEGGGGKAVITISALSSREVNVLFSGSLGAGVVDDDHSLVYCSSVYHRSLSPKISSNLCRKAAEQCLFVCVMV